MATMSPARRIRLGVRHAFLLQRKVTPFTAGTVDVPSGETFFSSRRCGLLSLGRGRRRTRLLFIVQGEGTFSSVGVMSCKSLVHVVRLREVSAPN